MQLNGVVQRKLALLDESVIRLYGYTDIDPEVVYTAATTRFDDFRKFRDAIDRL